MKINFGKILKKLVALANLIKDAEAIIELLKKSKEGERAKTESEVKKPE
jgi:hypothetical protein